MNDRDCYTCDAMEKYGWSFVQQLARLARQADQFNLKKIKSTWHVYWQQYEKMGRSLEDQKKPL